MKVVIIPRDASVAQVIQACAEGSITFGEACERISAMGYKTTSVHEMVVAAEAEIRRREQA